jgi:hypothetical protein
MRMRPPKHVREQMRNDSQLAALVLRGDTEAARREALRIHELKLERDRKAAEFARNRGARYGGY